MIPHHEIVSEMKKELYEAQADLISSQLMQETSNENMKAAIGMSAKRAYLGEPQLQELALLKTKCQELKKELTKMSATTEKTFGRLIPDLQGALRSLEANGRSGISNPNGFLPGGSL